MNSSIIDLAGGAKALLNAGILSIHIQEFKTYLLTFKNLITLKQYFQNRL